MSKAITKKQALSEPAREAWFLAEYRLRHNARYAHWGETRRFKFCMAKVFDAVVRERLAAEERGD